MAKRRKKAPTPLMILWSRQDQRRFIDAVEKFHSDVNDLAIIAEKLGRRSEGARKANQTRKAAAAPETAPAPVVPNNGEVT